MCVCVCVICLYVQEGGLFLVLPCIYVVCVCDFVDILACIPRNIMYFRSFISERILELNIEI